MRALIVGGGTGGHVIPGLAIARELRDRHSAECLFLGTPRGMESKLVPAAGFPLELIRVGQLKNVSPLTRLKTLADLPRSAFVAAGLLRRWRPNVVISVGGYASGPGAIAALLLRIPVLAFEPNLVPGFANKRIARFVSAAAVQFPQTASLFRNGEVTGVPIRREFFDIAPLEATAPPQLLVFGGSQGARAINDAVMAALPALAIELPDLRIVHQTGAKDVERTRGAYRALPSNTRLASSDVREFIDDMPAQFAAAHLVVCRSGASTVAEVAASARCAIFVPFPQAADDHQTKNAEALVAADAALLLPQAQLTAESLTAAILQLFRDPARLAAVGANARRLAHPAAAERIAKLALRIAKR